MFTHKDVELRSIFVINCLEKRALKVESGNLLLEDTETDKKLTKLPFQKILALFVIGHITVTSALIDKCTKFGVPIIIMKPNFRLVFFFSITAEANFLLRKRQYQYEKENLQIAKILVANKIKNQLRLLEKIRTKNTVLTQGKNQCKTAIQLVGEVDDYDSIMGLEGAIAKMFFDLYFKELNWKYRCPRVKIDPINTTLDIGYTILFNYIEAFVRLFGFDPYIGVYHRLWFKRKSLVCDLMEPFRCIIDLQVRKSYNLGQFKVEDFLLFKNEYVLKREKSAEYTKCFFDALIVHKATIFKYIQQYYRCFMQCKSTPMYPEFLI